LAKPKVRWHIWSTREDGALVAPKPIRRLPKGCLVSADGQWAELHDDKGVAKVFVKQSGRAVVQAPRRKVA
jgi:hypothetical protein